MCEVYFVPAKYYSTAAIFQNSPNTVRYKDFEAASKGYFVPADRNPDHIQRIKNGDLLTEVKILYADGRTIFYC